MKQRVITLLVAILAAPTTSWAQAGDLYGIIGMQNSEVDADTSALSDAGLSIDDNDASYNFGIGYQVNDTVSIEAGYMDMGTPLTASGSYSATSAGSGTYGTSTYSYTENAAGTVNADADADGWTLGAVFNMPVTPQIDLLAKAGYYFWDADVTATGTVTGAGSVTIDGTTYSAGGTASISASSSKSGEDLYYGIGGSYKLDDNYTVRGDYTRYEVWDQDVDVIGAALLVKF